MPPKTELDILRGARSRIEQGHTKGEFARDCDDFPVNPGSELAECFCILGAFRGPGGCADTDFPAFNKAHERFAQAAGIPNQFGDFALFNDRPETTQQTILDVLDKAIEAAEKEQHAEAQ